MEAVGGKIQSVFALQQMCLGMQATSKFKMIY
jgi:hypothetical protein